jgi:tRNA dimethylallyltransferase
MLAAGWLEEVRALIRMQVRADAKPFTFLGYSQLRDCVLKAAPLDAAVAEIQQATRRYAKRQITWFRREPDVHWLEGFGREERVQAQALQFASERRSHT